MMKIAAILIALFLVPLAYADCIVPSSNTAISADSMLCTGAYALDTGIVINGNNITLDCNMASLAGTGVGYGILLKDRANVRITNCNISNFEIGIYVENTNDSLISDNILSKNKFGIALYNSFNNNVENNLLSGNSENSVSYFPQKAPELENELIAEQKSSPAEMMKEVVRVKNPLLSEKDVVKEVDIIFSRHFNFTKENLEIKREIIYNESDGSTTIVLHLKPKKILLNVSVYEKIPKCISEYAANVFFGTPGYEVIENDPLILWTFARMEKENEISYKVFKNVGEDCRRLLLAFGIASGFGEEKREVNEKGRKGYFFIPVIAAVLIVALFLIKKRSS